MIRDRLRVGTGLLAPDMVGRLAETVLATQLRHRHPAFGMAENVDYLFGAEPVRREPEDIIDQVSTLVLEQLRIFYSA